MPSFGGGLAQLSAVYPGYVQGQEQLALLAQQKEKADAIKRQGIIEAGVGRTLAADTGTPSGGLGALSAAPPPQGPGQASVPMQPGPAGGAPGPQGAMPPGGPPQGAPQGAAPPPGGPQGQPSGPMTVGQMAKQIMAANPGMDFKTPEGARALLGMVERNQQLLAPQAKEELAKISLSMKIDQANQKLELGYANLETRKQIADQANAFRAQLAQMKDDQVKQHMQQQLDMLHERLAHDDKKTDTLEEGRNSRAGAKSRADMVKAATKAGVAVDPAWTDDEIQKHAAEAVRKKAESTTLSDDQAQYMAEAVKSDPSLLSRLGSGPSGNANKTKVLGIIAGNSKPEALAQGRNAMAASTAEGRTAGTQTGRVALGMKELEKFAPLVLSASSKVSRTQYPSVNALIEAGQKGTGGTEVITLANNLNALKNAYAQVIARGGQVTEGARKQASDLVDKAYSDGQIKAAVAAMLQEAKAAGQAASEVTSDIAGKGKTAESAAAPAAGNRVKYDAQGNRIP